MNPIKKILLNYANVFDNRIAPEDFDDIVEDIEKYIKKLIKDKNA